MKVPNQKEKETRQVVQYFFVVEEYEIILFKFLFCKLWGARIHLEREGDEEGRKQADDDHHQKAIFYSN